MSTTLIEVPVDEDVLEQVNGILRTIRITPSQLIGAVYEFIATNGHLPDFIMEGERDCDADVEPTTDANAELDSDSSIDVDANIDAEDDSADPVLMRLHEIFSYVDSILPPGSTSPELTTKDVEQTWQKVGFDNDMPDPRS